MKITTPPLTTPLSQSVHLYVHVCSMPYTHLPFLNSSHHLYLLRSHLSHKSESMDRVQLATDAANLHFHPFSIPTWLNRNLFRQNRFLCIKSASGRYTYRLRLRRRKKKRYFAVFESLFFPHLLHSLEIMMQPEVFQRHFVVKVEIEVLQHLPARNYMGSPRDSYDGL